MRLAKALEMPLDVAHLPAALYFDGAQAVADRALLALADLGAAGADDAAQDKLHAAVVAARAYEKPKFPLTGAMMQKAGLADGPAMGTMSQTLERWWVAEGFPNAAAVEAELKRRV
jgi:poly(A) polymerase